MTDPFSEDPNDTGVAFQDMVLLALAGFVAIVILILPFINPTATAEPTFTPGNITVEIYWPDELDADVDLWVLGPGDRPVGYSNRGGVVFNLLRDDLGNLADTTPFNYEVAYSRGLPAGEYVVNVHLYRFPMQGNFAGMSNKTPIEVQVVVGVKENPGATWRRLAGKSVTLSGFGQEITVMRFTIDEAGALVRGSINDVPKALRAATPGAVQ